MSRSCQIDGTSVSSPYDLTTVLAKAVVPCQNKIILKNFSVLF